MWLYICQAVLLSDRDGTVPGAVWHPCLQAGLLRGSVAAAQPGVERRSAGGCAERGAVPQGRDLPGGRWAGPGGASAEGGEGETGLLQPCARAGQAQKGPYPPPEASGDLLLPYP